MRGNKPSIAALLFAAAVSADRQQRSSAAVVVSPKAPSLQPPRLLFEPPPPIKSLQRKAQNVLKSNAARHLIAGAAAGVVSNTAVAPLDILRLNLMVSSQKNSVLQVARQIYSQGGVFAFWQGNLADVMRTIPASAVRFYSFAVYKAALPAYLALASITAPAVTSVLAGGFAGMTAMALLFPLETVRTQMATSGALNGLGIIGFTRGLVQTNGVRGLYRGLPTSLVCKRHHTRARTQPPPTLSLKLPLSLSRVRAAVMPYFGIRFGVYDILRRYHLAIAGDTPIPSQFAAVYGFASGFAASGLTFPMEVVRRRAMVGAAAANPFKAVPAIIAAEGVAGLYKGYGVNVIKVAPSSAITFLTYETVRRALDSIATEKG